MAKQEDYYQNNRATGKLFKMGYCRKEFEDHSYEVVDNLVKNYKGNIELLPAREQEIVRIWRLETDMYNGGFIKLLENWGYSNLKKTLEVLQKISANTSYLIVSEYIQTISSIQNKIQHEELHTLTNYLTDQQKKRIAELEEMYWDNPDDIQLLCYNCYLHKSMANN